MGRGSREILTDEMIIGKYQSIDAKEKYQSIDAKEKKYQSYE